METHLKLSPKHRGRTDRRKSISSQSATKIVLTGDVYLEHPTVLEIPGAVVFNHEYVVSKDDDPPSASRVNLVAQSQHALEAFPQATELHACFSNNHADDFGPAALKRTVEGLEDAGVSCYGDVLEKPLVVNHLGDVTWGLLNYSMAGTSRTKTAETLVPILENDVRDAVSAGVQLVLVALHFGNEHEPLATNEQRAVARAAIDAGAELVVGHHTHCVQDAEIYRGKHIFYGLGNTWFPAHSTPAYFNEEGQSERTFHARPTRWTSRSLLVALDVTDRRIRVWECASRGDRFGIERETSVGDINRSVSTRRPVLVGHLRRHWLFWKSNVLIDGKLIDLGSFTHKLVEKARYHGLLPRRQ